MLVDPSDQQHRLHTAKPQIPAVPQNKATLRVTADPIFSRSRPAQIAAAPGLSLPVLKASGALCRIRWLNRSPYEGRRRKGTLKGRSATGRPNARARPGPLPRRGLPARDSATRSAPGGRQRRTESGRPRRRGPPHEIAGPRPTWAREILPVAGLCEL